MAAIPATNSLKTVSVYGGPTLIVNAAQERSQVNEVAVPQEFVPGRLLDIELDDFQAEGDAVRT